MAHSRESLEYTYCNFIRGFQTQSNTILTINNNIHNALREIMTSPSFGIENQNNRFYTQNNGSDSELTSPQFPSPSQPTMSSNNISHPQERRGSVNTRRRRTMTRQPINDVLRITPMRPFRQPIRFTTTNAPVNFLDRVPVYPTAEQIENATSLFRFCDISGPMNSHCPIRNGPFSNDDIVIRINQCQHIFYPTELHTWFRNNVNCPLCRCDIRENTTTNILSPTTNNTDTPNNLVHENTQDTIETNQVTPIQDDANDTAQANQLLEEFITSINSNQDDNINNNINQQHFFFDLSGNQTNDTVSPIIETMSQSLAQGILETFRDNPNILDISGFEMSMSFLTETPPR